MCNEDYKQFRLTSDGVLLHHCSGKRVCPQGRVGNGVNLVISSSCTEESSKFVRTKGIYIFRFFFVFFNATVSEMDVFLSMLLILM
mgnify:CR=1 FL=1